MHYALIISDKKAKWKPPLRQDPQCIIKAECEDGCIAYTWCCGAHMQLSPSQHWRLPICGAGVGEVGCTSRFLSVVHNKLKNHFSIKKWLFNIFGYEKSNCLLMKTYMGHLGPLDTVQILLWSDDFVIVTLNTTVMRDYLTYLTMGFAPLKLKQVWQNSLPGLSFTNTVGSSCVDWRS